jgi:hypothetical protein
MNIKTLPQNIKIRGFSAFMFKTLLIGALWLLSLGNNTQARTGRESGKSERVISFSGYDWLVKSSRNSISGTTGPGNNYFSDSKKNVWVDKNGWLHLKISRRNGKWYCAEVVLKKSLGYKKYIFQVSGRVDQFHPNVVGGLFTYLDGTDHPEEIDIEFSKWGDEKKVNDTQYSIQPTDIQGNTNIFSLNLNGDASTHSFDWKPGKVDFTSYHGHYFSLPADSTSIIRNWSYSGKDVPADQNGKIHINLWLFHRDMINLSDHPVAEMIIKNFHAF